MSQIHIFQNEQKARVFAAVHNLRAFPAPRNVEIAAAILRMQTTLPLTDFLKEKKLQMFPVFTGCMSGQIPCNTGVALYNLMDSNMVKAYTSQVINNELHDVCKTPGWRTHVAPLKNFIPYKVELSKTAVVGMLLGGKTHAHLLTRELVPLTCPNETMGYLLQKDFIEYKDKAEDTISRLKAELESCQKTIVEQGYKARAAKVDDPELKKLMESCGRQV